MLIEYCRMTSQENVSSMFLSVTKIWVSPRARCCILSFVLLDISLSLLDVIALIHSFSNLFEHPFYFYLFLLTAPVDPSPSPSSLSSLLSSRVTSENSDPEAPGGSDLNTRSFSALARSRSAWLRCLKWRRRIAIIIRI